MNLITKMILYDLIAWSYLNFDQTIELFTIPRWDRAYKLLFGLGPSLLISSPTQLT